MNEEAIGFLVLLAAFGIFLVLPIWIIVAIRGLRRRAENGERRNVQPAADLRWPGDSRLVMRLFP